MRSVLAVLAILSLVCLAAPRVNADSDVRTQAHSAKQGIKDAGRSIGPAFKKLGHQVGDGVKNSVHTLKNKLHHPKAKAPDTSK